MSTIRIEHEVAIRRPRADVFAFISDHDHRPAWTNGVSRVKRTTAGPIGVGTTYTVVGRSMGRRVESTYELTEYEPSSRFAGRLSSKLFTVDETYVFDDSEGETTVRLTADATPGRALRLLGPLLGFAVDRQIQGDHQRLKKILERRRRKRPQPVDPAVDPAAEPAAEPTAEPEAVTEG